MAEVLVGEALVVDSGERRILDVRHLALREGEILAVLGPNGAGKSTLLRVMAMLQRPSSGVVRFREQPPTSSAASLRAGSAAVFQRPHLWAGSVRENLELGLRLRGTARDDTREAAGRAAERFGISHLLEAHTTGLSAGEVQRVAIARALALDPQILFLDEPTANLDSDVRVSLREDLERVARAGHRSTFLTTHDRAEAFFLADRVAVISGGRLVQVGTPAELYENPADPFIAAVTGAEFSLRGVVESAEDGLLHIRVGEVGFTAVGTASTGREVKVAYRPEDLLLAREETPGTSPRNRFRARVLEVRAMGSLLRVRLEGPSEMVAVVTRAASEELGLHPGRKVFVQIKASALHAFPL
jgi:tungstate transport system ATP-binding protein